MRRGTGDGSAGFIGRTTVLTFGMEEAELQGVLGVKTSP